MTDDSMGDLFMGIAHFARAKVCVEIGVRTGNTTSFLCRAMAKTGGRVIGFDAWSAECYTDELRTDFYTSAQWKKVIKSADQQAAVQARLSKEGHRNFELVKRDTVRDRDAFLRDLDRIMPIDFAFIDGCHTYRGVKMDFEAVYPRLSAAGLIAFHDTLYVDGVREFMLDLRAKFNDGTFDMVDLPWGQHSKRVGVVLLAKRSQPYVDRPIVQKQGSPSSALDIMTREREWYDAQIKP